MTNPESGSARGRRRWLRKVAIGLGVVVGVWALAAAWLLATAWYRVPGHAPGSVPGEVSLILTPDQYGAVIDTHARPYLYGIDLAGGGRVVVFGSEHTKDPDDPQMELIRAQWHALQPTVALVESDLGMLFPMFMDPVRTFGEVGEVHALARTSGARTMTWEPQDADVIESVIDQGFTPDQVALRWVLGPSFSNRRFGRPEDPDAFVLDTLGERGRVAPIAGILTTMADIDAAWAREFPDGPDWRDVSDQYGLPGILGEMDLNHARDVHLVSCVAELVAAGERVFVIAGSSHAVKIEPALRAIVE